MLLPLLFALGWFGCTAAGSISVFLYAPAGLVLLALGIASGYGAVATSLNEPGGGAVTVSDFAAYLDRLIELNREAMSAGDLSDLLTGEGLQRASAEALPSWERLAERAGLDLDQIFGDMRDSLTPTIALILARIVHGGDLAVEIGSLTVSIAVQMFLAGVNWEQERNMPAAPTGEAT